MAATSDRVDAILKRYGTTYAQQAGIRLADKPAPLYQLLVLATLLSARISSEVAVATAHELFTSGFHAPQRMADATWQQRVDALGRGHYRRYDEKTATMLGDGTALLLERHRGDLSTVRDAADTIDEVSDVLQGFLGIGTAGADIFMREVQGMWTSMPPHIDPRIKDGAKRLGLPRAPEKLARLVKRTDLPRLTAACVRAGLDKSFEGV